MILPLRRAEVLGDELSRLGRDDGARLADVIAELRGELAREPSDLVAMIVLVNALALAGRTTESHPLSWRAYEHMKRLPAVAGHTFMNVAAGLSEAGYLDEAKECYELAQARDPSLPGLEHNTLNLALRYGEFTWLERFITSHQAIDHLRRHNLAASWGTQQTAVEQILRPRTATFEAACTNFHDGTSRVVLDYFTDRTGTELDALTDRVWTAVEHVHHAHPNGPGALLGAVVLTLHGPEIPLPEGS